MESVGGLREGESGWGCVGCRVVDRMSWHGFDQGAVIGKGQVKSMLVARGARARGRKLCMYNTSIQTTACIHEKLDFLRRVSR